TAAAATAATRGCGAGRGGDDTAEHRGRRSRPGGGRDRPAQPLRDPRLGTAATRARLRRPRIRAAIVALSAAAGAETPAPVAVVSGSASPDVASPRLCARTVAGAAPAGVADSTR